MGLALLSTLDIFVPSVDLLTYLAEHDYEIDWNSVSENKKLTGDVIDTFKDKINWNIFVNRCPALLSVATVDFLKKYKDAISWDDFNERLGLDVTTGMLQEFANQLNWRFVSQSQKIKFTEELVRKYEDKWFWSELMRNIKFKKTFLILKTSLPTIAVLLHLPTELRIIAVIRASTTLHIFTMQ